MCDGHLQVLMDISRYWPLIPDGFCNFWLKFFSWVGRWVGLIWSTHFYRRDLFTMRVRWGGVRHEYVFEFSALCKLLPMFLGLLVGTNTSFESRVGTLRKCLFWTLSLVQDGRLYEVIVPALEKPLTWYCQYFYLSLTVNQETGGAIMYHSIPHGPCPLSPPSYQGSCLTHQPSPDWRVAVGVCLALPLQQGQRQGPIWPLFWPSLNRANLPLST